MHRPLMSITAASIGIAILVAGAAAFQPGAATDAGRSIAVSGGAAADAEATPHDHAAMAMETEPMPHAQAHSSPDADGAPTMHAHSPNPGATAEPTAHLHAAGAGDATEPMPAAGARAKKHRHGLVDPTAEEIACGNDLVERTREATARLADFDAAVAEGYRGNPNNPEGTHFGNAMYHRDGAVLDLARPEALVYWKNPATGERVLLGALFKAQRGQAGPQPWFTSRCLT